MRFFILVCCFLTFLFSNSLNEDVNQTRVETLHFDIDLSNSFPWQLDSIYDKHLYKFSGELKEISSIGLITNISVALIESENYGVFEDKVLYFDILNEQRRWLMKRNTKDRELDDESVRKSLNYIDLKEAQLRFE